MNNIRVYDPEVKKFGQGTQYFCDDKGRDFYDSRDLFTKKYVVLFDQYGVVRCVAPSSRVTETYPAGLSISDVNILPDDISIDVNFGVWVFNGRKVVKADIDPSYTTAQTKSKFMATITEKITPLKDAVEMGEATEGEVEQYNTLVRLRIKLNRIDNGTPMGDIDWSEFTAA